MTEFFQGRGLRPGVAIAAAASLRTEYGVASLDTQRLRGIGERLRRFGMEAAEPEQVILVADTLPPGFALAPVPGLEYAGVAAQAVTGGPELVPCPAVTDLPDGLLSAVEEGDILIVDGDRGRVYLSPDAPTLSRYQAPARHSRRFFLDSAHLPARTTSDNRLVSVLASVGTWEAAQRAIDGGADGLWLPPRNEILGAEDAWESSADQLRTLTRSMGLAAGKPLFLQLSTERLSFSALLQAGSLGALHLVLEDVPLRRELGERIAEIESALEEQDIRFGSLKIEAGVSTREDAAEIESLDDYSGLFVTEPVGQARMERLMPLAGLAQHAHKPLTLMLPPEYWETPLAEALDLRVGRVIVASPEIIADVKDAIRVS